MKNPGMKNQGMKNQDMKNQDKLERMKELVGILEFAARDYYQGESPSMADQQYDRLSEELAQLEKETGIIMAGSPSINVGYEVVSSLEKAPHESQLLSLDKTKETSSLADFAGEEACLLSWKLDGLTMVLHYNSEGALVRAITRGNGQIGEDVTHNARVFKNIPQNINALCALTLRGEAVISFEDFNSLNAQLPEDSRYKNPRNLTSGSVRQHDSEAAAGRNLRFFAFGVSEGQGSPKTLADSKKARLDMLEGLGFDVAPYRVVRKEEVEQAVAQFQQELAGFPYATDGLVLTYDSTEYSVQLGQTSRFPHDSLAFKWQDEQAETTLLEVVWNTSRTGLVNPVAVFEPVELEGSTVRQASLHNVSILEGLELGLGDRISVIKANMIIPQVVDNYTRSASLALPKACPVCGFPTELQNNGIKLLYCRNTACSAQLVRALSHYVSRDCANIEGLSEASLEKFVNKGLISSYADIYRLPGYSDEISKMEGFGNKSFAKLAASVERSLTIPLANFINALGIPHVGLSNAKILAGSFKYEMEAIRKATQEELEAIDGFGEAIAASLVSYFNAPENAALLDEVVPKLNFQEPSIGEGGKLSGLTFVITGDTRSFPNRAALKAYIEREGAKVASAVTAKTSFLINNNPASASAKNKKAHQLGVKIITEDELLLI